jgi:transposase
MNYGQIITEAEAELERLEAAQKLVQFQKRVRFLRLLKTGEAKTQEAAGKLVGWQKRQSQKIWALYRKGAIEEVLRKPPRYRLGKLSSQEMARLQQYLREFRANSLSEVRDLIKLMFEVEYSESGVCVLFQRLRIKLKTPRPSNIRKDERGRRGI